MWIIKENQLINTDKIRRIAVEESGVVTAKDEFVILIYYDLSPEEPFTLFKGSGKSCHQILSNIISKLEAKTCGIE